MSLLMIDMLTFGILVWITIVLLIIVAGSELFTMMIEEQIRYLRLIIHYAPLPATVSIPSRPEPVARYVSWALGENRNPVRCVHIRFTGRCRYGKSGRWMDMGGEAFFSVAIPGFVWRATTTYAPGIWLKTFDYYVDSKAGMNLNLFSLFPLDNAHDDAIKTPSLFRYLACTPLFPMIHGQAGFISWENIDDSTSKAIISDKGRSVEALARFNGRGWIESIDMHDKTNPETGKPLNGHFATRFSSYTQVEGYWIPMQVDSDMILPDGEYVTAEYSITEIEFDTAMITKRSVT
ncbi:MAG: hypothetical protein Q8S57_09940 [Methanoregula sp.]|nr:hypothetical protein [Methanoregula sp.]